MAKNWMKNVIQCEYDLRPIYLLSSCWTANELYRWQSKLWILDSFPDLNAISFNKLRYKQTLGNTDDANSKPIQLTFHLFKYAFNLDAKSWKLIYDLIWTYWRVCPHDMEIWYWIFVCKQKLAASHLKFNMEFNKCSTHREESAPTLTAAIAIMDVGRVFLSFFSPFYWIGLNVLWM